MSDKGTRTLTPAPTPRSCSNLRIDLKVVYERLAGIEKDIKAARDRHNEFLKDLGLPPI